MDKRNICIVYLLSLGLCLMTITLFFAMVQLMIHCDTFRINFYHMFGKDGFVPEAEWINGRMSIFIYAYAFSPLISIIIMPITLLMYVLGGEDDEKT